MNSITAVLVGLALLQPVKAQEIPTTTPPQTPNLVSTVEFMSVDDRITMYAEKEGVDPKILVAISYCERDHTDPNKENHNADGSTDYSVFQVNSIHQKDALDVGLDIKNMDDNIIFAIELFKEEGLAPWKASKTCRDRLLGET